MNRFVPRLTLALSAVVLSACSGTGQNATPATPGARTLAPQQTHAIAISTPPVTAACPSQTSEGAECDVEQRDDVEPLQNSDDLTPSQIPGYHPSDVIRAYALPGGTGGTIAIVVPYTDASAESDLAVYRAKFGLAPCTTGNGCLRFIAQDGSSTPAHTSDRWSIETALDLEVASAACPSCSLLVVEASSDALTDMSAALQQAIAQHPAVVSNSWVVPESAVPSVAPLQHAGVAVVAGTGDSASGVSWPASDPSVIAVGGTTLAADQSARGFTESGWSNAGYGCSAVFSKPSWQTTSGCATRGVADVSAIADPATGVAIYTSVPMTHGPHAGVAGWAVYGGTSVATPIVAAAIALANNPAQLSTPQYVYQHASGLNPVTPAISPLQGGLGSPNGIGAF